MLKRCGRCREMQPVNTFSPDPSTRSGLYTYCRPCNNAYSREWHARHRERPGVKERLERNRRKTAYNVTDYDERLEIQGGVCGICRQPETATRLGKVRSLCIDHDHACCPGPKSCGRCVRGLLCRDCNSALAFAKDSRDTLLAAIAYLTAFDLP